VKITRLLAANSLYADEEWEAVGDVRPSRRLAVLTCMDSRIDVDAVLGLHVGEAHVIRNAGGRVTDDVLRSLALSTHGMGVDTVVVMQHTRCGLAGVSDAALRASTGADLAFLPISDHEADLRHDLDVVWTAPYLASVRTAAAFLYDTDTGKVDQIHRHDRP
jgi:carbonic anhydrase